jgi:hypothetical protein
MTSHLALRKAGGWRYLQSLLVGVVAVQDPRIMAFVELAGRLYSQLRAAGVEGVTSGQ